MSDVSHETTPPTPEGEAILASLRKSVSKAIETKKKLGQYYVQITMDSVELVGPDAPANPDNA